MENKLISFFKKIKKEKLGITNVKNGYDFELNLGFWLKNVGFDELDPLDNESVVKFLDDNKEFFQNKSGSNILVNDTGFNDIYIHQPYKQNYPDFLIFTDGFVYPVECKYTSKMAKAPVWNNNLPKKNGLYIFGSSGLSDLTYFRGEDVLPNEEREFLNSFFDSLNALERFHKDALKAMKTKGYKFEYGFSPYIRTSFKQNKNLNSNANLNFFEDEVANKNEDALRKFLKK